MISLFGIFTGPIVLLIWLICIPLLLKRIGLIKGTFKNGEVVKGAIIENRFWRGRWTVHYAFKLNDKVHQTRNYIIAFKLPFKKGEPADIVVDPKKPKVAFLKEIYQ